MPVFKNPKRHALVVHCFPWDVPECRALIKYYFDEIDPFVIADERPEFEPNLIFNVCASQNYGSYLGEYFKFIDVFSGAGESFINSDNAFRNLTELLLPGGTLSVEVWGLDYPRYAYRNSIFRAILDLRFRDFSMFPQTEAECDKHTAKFSYRKSSFPSDDEEDDEGGEEVTLLL
ncbi:hypothetical protein ACJJIF_07415 [Microbulbifer sp. SSSA002]|uniref:hypothetical protein n=1 Tax=unclassified Microbulbifer TaxID=2619833 RepID=UPI004039871D